MSDSSPPGSPLLAAVDVVAGYVPGVDILAGCTVEVGATEIVGIVGPNGAGKSTLLKAVFGLLPVRSGSVRLGGDEITALPAHQLVERGMAYVPQRGNVFPSLTVEENLHMGVYLQPSGFDEGMARVAELFPLVGQRRGQRAGSLSGGERQMVAMARALMMDPKILLLDEPSAGLSPAYQEQVFQRVTEINRGGVAVAMVEQNARRCLEIAHRGYVLDQGRDAHTGTGAALLGDPKVVELYLGTVAATRPR